MSLISISGFIALITYILSIVPKNITTVFPSTKKLKVIKLLFKYRKHIGLTTFFWASVHASITISHYNIDLLSLNTYFNYYSGISAFIIFTLLAATSNKFSIKRLKKNWKVLHNLTYVAMILLLIHIWVLMKNNWSNFTGIGLFLLGSIAIIYFIRLSINLDLSLWQGKRNNRQV